MSFSHLSSNQFKILEWIIKEQEDDFPSLTKKSRKELDISRRKDLEAARKEGEEIENPLFIKRDKVLRFSDKQIRQLSNNHVLEVKFKRRIWPPQIKQWNVRGKKVNKKPWRRMLCTANWKFVQGNKELQFTPPKGIAPRSKSWYVKRRLIIVWDCILRQWRHISLDDYDLVDIYPIKTKEQQKDFMRDYNILMKSKGKRKLVKRFNK